MVETLAERPEDPLALYSVLYGVWSANYTMYNGAAIRELAGQFLELAVKDGTKIPLMVGHRLMASSGAFYAASSVAPEIPERRGGKAAPRQVTADD